MLISTGPRLPELNSEGDFEVDSTPLPSAEENQLMESLQREGFVTGFAKGMAAGGLDMVTGTGDVIVGTMKYVGRGLLTFGCQIRFIGQLLTGQDTNATMNMMLEISAPNAQVHDQIQTIAKGLIPVAQWMLSNAENLHALQIAMFTGNFQGIDSAFMRSSELNGALFSMGAEMIAGALEEYQNDPPGVKGYKVGRVVFEVLAVLLPISKAGKLAQLHKSELLTKVLNANVLPQRLVPKMNVLKNALSTTKMCFVASTLVMCQVEGAARLEPIGGLESLAQVHSELKVWARDEFTGEEGWKRPIAWFTTHPEELFTLSVDTDADGVADEELTGTGEHPFWVEAYRAFLPMRDLRPGMRLSLAQKGTVAIVTGNVSQRGPPGHRFTTYNFEVEDFHTYFVGEAGVWVHNFSKKLCEEAEALFSAVKDQMGISDASLPGNRLDIVKEAWKRTKPMPGNGPGHVLHALQRDEFVDYASRRTTLNKLKNYVEQKRMLELQGGDGVYDVHHVVEKRFQSALGLSETDNVPGLALPKSPRAAGFDAANYQETFGHAPIYHGGTLEEGSLVQKLGEIRRRFPANGLSLTQQNNLIEQMSVLYKSPPYDQLNMWPVARDWLEAQRNSLDPGIIIPN